MNYRIFLCLLAGCLVFGCSSTPGGGTGGTGGESSQVTIETFNLALAGAFIPYEQARRQPLAEAIANAEADILCLQEVWTQADKEMIRDAAATNYPNVVIFEDDLDTPLDDPTDQNGEIPPPWTTVPCPDVDGTQGSGTVEEQMSAAIDCVALNCNTKAPGDETGRTTSTSCAEAECIDVVAPLIVGDAQQQRCYSCLAPQLPTSTFAEIRATCPTVINQVLAFEGQNGVMILSRYPLKDAANWVIPGTWNQRVIMSATAELPGGRELDIYCNHLTPIFDGAAFPYTGQYGDGMIRAAGWEAEQQLQAQKLIDYVETTSGDSPAAILGDLNAGHAFPDQGIVAEGAPTLDLLETAFTPANAAGYTPQCTFCAAPTNPLNGPECPPGEAPAGCTMTVWIDHILLYNMSADSIVSTVRTFDENVVPVDSGAGGAGGGGGAGGAGGGVELVPLSDHYGLQSVIRVP